MNVIYSVKDYVSNVFLQDSVSGAVDIVVVQQPDGSLRCSPFHVHFGKAKLDDQQQVTLEVNGQAVDGVRMKLGEAGEAYFVHEVLDPVNLASPFSKPITIIDSKAVLHHDTSEAQEPEEEEQTPNLKKCDLSDRLTLGRDPVPSLRQKHVVEKELPSMVKSASIYFDAVDIETSASFAEMNDIDYYDHPSMSLCGNLIDQAETGEDAQRIFVEHIVTFDTFRSNSATILTNPNLRFFVNGKVTPYDANMQAYFVSRVLFPYSQHLPIGKSAAIVSSTNSVATDVNYYESTGLNHSHLSLNRPLLEPLDEMFSDDGGSTQDTASLTSEPYYRKSLEPSQDVLRQMKLRVGMNEISFVLGSHEAGELACVTAKLYLWPLTAKVVIAQLDGAIAGGAATGGMFKRRDPAALHSGAVEFYSKLAQNGYHIVYVTCLGLSQANLLHTLLHHNARENDEPTLPMGPVLLSPDPLIANITTEAHDFQVAALGALRSLFPQDVNPFYAAFGSTEIDSVVFTKVGVFYGKVFVVNPRDGSLHHHLLLDFSESYTSLLERMDAMFPHFHSLKPHILVTTEPTHPSLLRSVSTNSHTFLVENEKRLVAAHVRTRSLADDAYNDINFWRIDPGRI